MDVVTLGAAKADAKKNYGGTAPQTLARTLLYKLRPQVAADPYTLATDIPTVTIGTAATLTGRFVGPHTGEVTEVGTRGAWNSGLGRLTANIGLPGLDLIHTGTAIEFSFAPFLSPSPGTVPIWIFVNGQPITATQDVTTAASINSGTRYYVKLTFGSVARRRVEFFAQHGSAWYPIGTALGDGVEPSPRRPVAIFAGDSIWAGTSGAATAFDVSAFWAARALGVECFVAGTAYGGTGYVATGSTSAYGSTARVAAAALASPDLIVFQGSLNDDGLSGIQAAAAQCYADHLTACPNALQLVLGSTPNNNVGTVSANRSANITAVKAAAAAASRVIGFGDECGVATSVPAAYSAGTAYNDGDLVTYKGSVWKSYNGGSTSTGNTPDTSGRWKLVTWGLYGTGKVGTTASDGTRDTFLYSDGTHPTALAQKAVFAPQIERFVRSALSYYASTGTQYAE